MNVVEAYAERMITFSKRKTGIFKKMSDLLILYGVEAAFLVFSECEKPYIFAYPSIEELAGRLNNTSIKETPNKDNTLQLVESHKKQRIDEFVKIFEALKEELAKVNGKLKLLKKSRNEKMLAEMWWNAPLEDLSVEKCQQRHQAFVELHDILYDIVLSQMNINGGASSSGRGGGGQSGGGYA